MAPSHSLSLQRVQTLLVTWTVTVYCLPPRQPLSHVEAQALHTPPLVSQPHWVAKNTWWIKAGSSQVILWGKILLTLSMSWVPALSTGKGGRHHQPKRTSLWPLLTSDSWKPVAFSQKSQVSSWGPHVSELQGLKLLFFLVLIKVYLIYSVVLFWGFLCSSDSKESACKAGDQGSIPGSGRSPGEENGNPLQYSCSGNPMDRGAWWATAHGVAKSQTWMNN